MRLAPALIAIATTIGLAWISISSAAAPRAGVSTFEIDASHSAVIFRIKHLGVANFYGRFNDISGKIVLDGDDPADSSVDVEIKTESIDTNNEGRDKHLKSPDFFNARQFPVISFESDEVSVEGDDFQVKGTLSLHGEEKTVTIAMTKVGEGKDPWGGQRVGFEGTLDIKRLDYGMNYNPDALGDDVRLILSIEAVRK